MRSAALFLLTLLVGCNSPKDPKAPVWLASSRGQSAAFRTNGIGISGVAAWLNEPTQSQAYLSGNQHGGLNWEHVIGGSRDVRNWMEPRQGPMRIVPRADGATLIRDPKDDAWGIAAVISYTLTSPHYIDFDFTATIPSATEFGPSRFASFFFASYMAASLDPEISFRGFAGPNQKEAWVKSYYAYPGNTFAILGSDLSGDNNDESIKLNLGQADWPRISQPFFYGRCANDMVYALLLDPGQDEIRFTVMRWIPGSPAWDVQLVARQLQDGRVVHLRGRAIWKRWVSEQDIMDEFLAWKQGY